MKKLIALIISLACLTTFAQKKDSSFHYLDKGSMQSKVLYTWPDIGAWGKLNGTNNANVTCKQSF